MLKRIHELDLKLKEETKTFEENVLTNWGHKSITPEKVNDLKTLAKRVLEIMERDLQEAKQELQDLCNHYQPMILAEEESLKELRRREDEEMHQLIESRCKRIVVEICGNDDGSASVIRKFKPVRAIGELLTQLEHMYSDYRVVLYVKGTNEAVQTQFEFKEAYEAIGKKSDSNEELQLTAKLGPKKRKRGEDVKDDEVVVVKQGIPWKVAEIELFAKGVELFGWGHWKAISTIVKSRDNEQCRWFARSKAGLQFYNGNNRNVIDGALNLAKAIDKVATCLVRDGEGGGRGGGVVGEEAGDD